MNKKRAYEIYKTLEKHYPNAKIVLNYSNDLELLIAIMLSAQTTDQQVNKATEILFPKFQQEDKRFINIYSKYSGLKLPKKEIVEYVNFAFCETLEIENYIKSIGLYKTKAKNIRMTSQILLNKYAGMPPKSINELVTLPGVGRKTANVFLSNAYKIIEGIAVDTHVKKLSLKYGFTKETNPEKIEKDLMMLFDKKDWFKLTYLLIDHGRYLQRGKTDFIA